MRPRAFRKGLLASYHENGLPKPHVSHTFDLDEVPAAMQMPPERKSTGRIVVTTGLTHA